MLPHAVAVRQYDMDPQPFALTGLTSRGGLSNWVVFVLPTETVLIDVGATPAIARGIAAGVAGQFGVAGIGLLRAVQERPSSKTVDLDDWRTQLEAKAKQVHVLNDADVRHVRLHLRATAHQLSIISADGITQTFSFMNRAAGPALVDPLTQRFGSRFETSITPAFGFFTRYAPFLMS
jgi:hypothetical protein